MKFSRLKTGWDEALPENLTSNWKDLTGDMKTDSSLAVHRCILDAIEVDKDSYLYSTVFLDQKLLVSAKKEKGKRRLRLLRIRVLLKAI